MAEITIPGDPSGLSALSSRLRAAAGDVESVSRSASSNSLEGSWSGPASQAFRASLQPLPGELARVSSAFEEAARAISTFASKLSEIQRKADWYNRQIEAARQEQRAAQARQLHAQTEVRAAEARHSIASDPTSLHTARAAVELGHSVLREAAAEVEDTVRRLSSLVAATVTLRAEYQAAVNACCGALDSARHSGAASPLAWLSSLVNGLIGGVDEGALAFAGRLGRFLADGAGGLHTATELAAEFVKRDLPVSKLQSWCKTVLRLSYDPAFIRAGHVFAVFGGVQDSIAAWKQSSGENLVGRMYTEAWFVGFDVVAMRFPAVAGANILTLGTVSADFKAIGLMGGHAITESMNRAEAEFRNHAGDNGLSITWHVAGGVAGGYIDGALKGNEVWAKNAEAGEYGGFVQGISQVANFGVDHAYAGVEAASRGVSGAARGAWDTGGRLLRSL